MIMCTGCWEEMGSPQIDSPIVREAAKLIAEVYRHNSVGGNLHIVVDDFNTEGSSVEWCAAEIERFATREGDENAEQVEAERKCVQSLLALTEAERASALALHDEFWE